MIMRPKRAIHCRSCNVCVEMFDHHCPFISNCVGKRNYLYFWWFINLLWVDTIFTIYVASRDIERRRTQFSEQHAMDTNESYRETFKRLPMTPLIILFCAFVLLGLTALVGYHYYLGFTFQTTYEHRKHTYANYLWRPFDSGSCWSNLRQRVFTKKSAEPIFNPLELHLPE